MSDVIRQALEMYGADLMPMMQEAGRIKEEYVAGGGDPAEVYSPERMDELARGGGSSVAELPPSLREDGSIAGPYVPTELALANNMIEPGALPAVLAGLLGGVNTVSSGVGPDGRGYAIGREPGGSVCRIST